MRPGPTHLRICKIDPGEADPADEGEGPVDVLDFEGVFRGYGRYVAAVALRILGRDDDVDDVVQDVFLAAMKGLGRVHSADAVRGWLRTITVRVACDRLRKRRWRAFLGLDDEPAYE